jgi:nitroreductase
MELKEVIEKRRTIRDFQSRAVPESIIGYAIGNGFKAPTYNHRRDWDFIIIRGLEEKLKLIEIENLDQSINIKELERLFRNEETIVTEIYLDVIPKQKKMILDAPSVVIVIFKPKTRVDKAKSIDDLNCLASVWACIENFPLSLAEHGVYGVTFIPRNIEKFRDTG